MSFHLWVHEMYLNGKPSRCGALPSRRRQQSLYVCERQLARVVKGRLEIYWASPRWFKSSSWRDVQPEQRCLIIEDCSRCLNTSILETPFQPLSFSKKRTIHSFSPQWTIISSSGDVFGHLTTYNFLLELMIWPSQLTICTSIEPFLFSYDSIYSRTLHHNQANMHQLIS